MSATVKDNIVFNYEFDETFYNLVLDGKLSRFHAVMLLVLTRGLLLACALRPDLALMPQGDMTEVGEKGMCIRFYVVEHATEH